LNLSLSAFFPNSDCTPRAITIFVFTLQRTILNFVHSFENHARLAVSFFQPYELKQPATLRALPKINLF
jgi:hypothetical protein